MVKNTFMSSNNMVPEMWSVPLVLHYHPCNLLLHIIRFLWISEVTEVPIQVGLLYIFIIGITHSPRQTLLRFRILWIYVSQFFQRLIKNTSLICPDYSTSNLIWWVTIKCTLIFIIWVVIDEAHHLFFYHLHIPPFIRRKLWFRLRSHFIFRGTALPICQTLYLLYLRISHK